MQHNHSRSNSDPTNFSSSQITPNLIQINRPQNAGIETEGILLPSTEGNSHLVGMRISSGLPFPFKLHAMLDNAAEGGYETIVSWCGDNGFMVHDKDAFVETIIPKYFSQTKYRSFQRLLNMWGFQRLREGPRKGAYYHEQYFQRGNASLCGKMKCEKIKKKPAVAKPKDQTQQQEEEDDKANSSELESNENQMKPPLAKATEKKVVTFDKATKPAAIDRTATPPLPSFEDTFGEVKQIIPVGKSKRNRAPAASAHPLADVFDPTKQQTLPAPLPTYTDLFENRQFHEVSKGDKIARVYGPVNKK